MAASQSNSSVDQVFHVLHVVAQAGGPVGVADVARRLDLSTSTAHRVLVTLVESGMLRRDSSETKYELGIVGRELAHALFARFPVRLLAEQPLRRIAAETGQTASLHVRAGWYGMRIAAAQGWDEISAGTRLGETQPLSQGAASLALLAALPDEEVARYVAWHRAQRPELPELSAEDLEQALAEIRKRGYALVLAETADPLRSLGVVLRDQAGVPFASASVEGDPARFDPRPRSDVLRVIRGHLDALQEACGSLSAEQLHPYAHIPADDIRLGVTGRS